MLQEIEMTDEEKLDMYMKLSKKEICTMLIEANKNLKRLPFVIQQSEQLLCRCGCPKGSVSICGRTDCNN